MASGSGGGSSVKRANPAVIGGFVLAAMALIAFGVMALGGARLFTPKQKVVSYFEGSVKGLTVGSAVNFRGVRVGMVDEIVLQFAPGSLNPRIPVYMTLLPNQIKLAGTGKDGTDLPFSAYIERGLRAKLSTDSLVTGALSIDLDFRPDVPAVMHGLREAEYAEIPAMKSEFDVIKDQLSELPLRQLADDLKKMVAAVSQLAGGSAETLGTLGNELKSTAETTRQTLEAAQTAIGTLNATLKSAEKTSDRARVLLETAGPDLQSTLRSARGAMLRFETTMANADVAVSQVTELTAPGASLRTELDQTLRDLSASAESLRDFADTVERQPNSLIFGKTKE